jgi:hypothetical protein
VGDGGQAVDDWGRYLTDLADQLPGGVAEMARRTGVHRSTIFGWISEGGQKVTVASVLAIARGVDADPRTALLAAANLLQEEQRQDTAPDIAEILTSGLPDEIQGELILAVLAERKRDEENRIASVRRMIRLAGGEVA